MEKINITAETEVSSDKLSSNEPANPKCNECGKMLNQEREMDSILSLDEAHQELKVKLEKKDQMLELKEEEITYLTFLLDEMEKELDMKNIQWEQSLELKLEELREKVQAQKKQLDEVKAALLDMTNKLQNNEQMFLKQTDEQQKTISDLEATLKMKEEDLKSRTDQWNQLEENEKAVKAITEKEALCNNENQSTQTQVLQTALDEAQKKIVEMEEERSNHIKTMSIMKATLTETQEAFTKLKATIQEQKQEKEKEKEKEEKKEKEEANEKEEKKEKEQKKEKRQKQGKEEAKEEEEKKEKEQKKEKRQKQGKEEVKEVEEKKEKEQKKEKRTTHARYEQQTESGMDWPSGIPGNAWWAVDLEWAIKGLRVGEGQQNPHLPKTPSAMNPWSFISDTPAALAFIPALTPTSSPHDCCPLLPEKKYTI
ncbi:DNA ligase 1-like [Gouania willdenowi]|uniref:DNA ligase 1-like n=1 Tax=Gouania willdenowi TaxID=441366 RepID=UPI0010559158|nr:DNA ligase 1-like [Gouania willdenowi]